MYVPKSIKGFMMHRGMSANIPMFNLISKIWMR